MTVYAINTRNMALCIKSRTGDLPVVGWQKYRRFVAGWLYDHRDPPFPPRIELSEAESDDLHAELLAARV